MIRSILKKLASLTFFHDRSGAFAVQAAVAITAITMAAGVALDFGQAVNKRWAVQNAGDAAILAAAGTFDWVALPSSLNTKVDTMLSVNRQSDVNVRRTGDVYLRAATSDICVNVAGQIQTSLSKIAGVDVVNVSSTSCASRAGGKSLEIALILDVSSSMIDEGRFDPMIDAANAFIDEFADDPAVKAKTKISLVPFSSRVNIGLPNTSWLAAYKGDPAVPSRWTNPSSTYDSKYKKLTWVDGQTTGYDNKKNVYWLGCIEPRSDVSVNDTGSVSSLSLTDATPKTSSFIAMDQNDDSGKSFCPQPIVPLSGDFASLKIAVNKMTSEGSTRLDAGLVAGWYTLSPKWRGLWGANATPADIFSSLGKVAIFMTDGAMNTQHGQGNSFDWICNKNKSDSCNTLANNNFLSVCTQMKAAGITIYTISYSDDADESNLANCATTVQHHFTATEKSGAGNFIQKVYTKIASEMKASTPRLSR